MAEEPGSVQWLQQCPLRDSQAGAPPKTGHPEVAGAQLSHTAADKTFGQIKRCKIAVFSQKKKRFLAQESLVGHYQAEDHDGYFRNGESNPGLQGENLLS